MFPELFLCVVPPPGECLGGWRCHLLNGAAMTIMASGEGEMLERSFRSVVERLATAVAARPTVRYATYLQDFFI